MPKTLISVKLEPALLAELDARAKSRGMARTEAVADAVKQWLGAVPVVVIGDSMEPEQPVARPLAELSTLDDFLAEEGITEEVTARAMARVEALKGPGASVPFLGDLQRRATSKGGKK